MYINNNKFVYQNTIFRTGDKVIVNLAYNRVVDDARLIILIPSEINSQYCPYVYLNKKWFAFCCQNKYEGRYYYEKLGYKYTWIFSSSDNGNDLVDIYDVQLNKHSVLNDIVKNAFPVLF